MHPSKQILHPCRERKRSPCCVGEFACAREKRTNSKSRFKVSIFEHGFEHLSKKKSVNFQFEIAPNWGQRLGESAEAMAAVFDRANPLFERYAVPFEVISSSNDHGSNAVSNASASVAIGKKCGSFTVRILQGHRPPRNGGGDKERVIRFEMSDECNLIDDSLDGPSASMNGISQTPIPIIHAPFMTADRGRGQSTIPATGHQTVYANGGHKVYQKETRHVPTRPIELFELEVGESDFSDLRRDQALLVDFHDFANSLISLMQFCERGEVDFAQPQEQNDFPDVHDYSGGWNRQTTQPMGHRQWGNDNGGWSTPSQTHPHTRAPNQPRQGMLPHVPRMTSPYGKLSCAMPISTYSCRLERDLLVSSEEGMQWRNTQKSSSMHARFSIVESNQFRELTVRSFVPVCTCRNALIATSHFFLPTHQSTWR